jgi:CBS domain-containing protein
MEIHPDDRVAAISTWPVVTLPPRATMREAAQLIEKEHVGALVVLPEGDAPLGIVTERDIVRALADGAVPDDVRAADLMTEEPRYATPAASIRAVAHEMLAVGVRHLPVLDEGEVVGMGAASDALRVLADAVPPRPAPHHADGWDLRRELARPGG